MGRLWYLQGSLLFFLSADLSFFLWLLGSAVCSMVIWVRDNDLKVEHLSGMVHSNGMRGKGFKLNVDAFWLDLRKEFYSKGGEMLSHVAQRCGRCPIPGSLQDQIGQGSGQPDLIEGVPAFCRWVWTRWPLKVPFQSKLFCDSVILSGPLLGSTDHPLSRRSLSSTWPTLVLLQQDSCLKTVTWHNTESKWGLKLLAGNLGTAPRFSPFSPWSGTLEFRGRKG